jgi:hypothetical protein
MQLVLFDSSIYITALRVGDRAASSLRRLAVDSPIWLSAVVVLARLAAKYDYVKIGRGRLTNDALITISAVRLGITVITANARDFMRLAEFRPF